MNASISTYDWFLKQDLSRYAGKWVALVDKRVAASGSNVEKVLREVNLKYPNKKPFLTKVRSRLSVL
ncbi:MAG TPA: DUF5678 domain-containing protein [Candidatus Nanoarchaeia archaeon]|nr:DUF5678 domain-containing protein [Candidatus Nanoarchaeia archaeon]